jgi:hypothetical protein
MALVSLPSPICWPGITGALDTSIALFTTNTLTAAGHYAAFIFAAREDMAITHVGCRIGTVAGSPTAEVRIETVDTSGLPSGTLWATNTNGTTGTITSDTNILQALTATANITKGQVFCVMIKYASGTSIIVQHTSLNNPVASNLPYRVLNTGTPTKGQLFDCLPTIALGSSSTTFYHVPGTLPVASLTTNAFNNTNSAKRGLLFTPPMSCRAVGIRWHQNNNAGNYNAVLYDSGGTELSSSSTAYDGDHAISSVGGLSTVFFDNPVTLTAGTTYRIAIEPSSATNCNVSTIVLPSANYRGASPAGATANYTTFATATWTDTATDTLPIMDVVIDQLDNGAGGGGAVPYVIG